MAIQYLTPNWGYLDETGSRQFFVPGSGFLNETRSTGSVGNAAGSSTATAAGVTAAIGTGSSAGTSNASGVAPSSSSDGTAAGTATVSGTGASLAASDGSSAGTSTASATSASSSPHSLVTAYQVPSWGYLNETAARQYFVPGKGFVNETQFTGYSGTAAGSSTAAAIGAALATSTALSSGSSAASAFGQAIVKSAGTASGAATATGDGAAFLISPFIGFSPVDLFNVVSLDRRVGTIASAASASGSASATAGSASTVAQAGAAAGTSEATGVVSGAVISSDGTAAGTSTATGIGGASAAYDPLAMPASPDALYSVIRPQGWVGNGIRALRVSDSAKKDFGYNSDNLLDFAAIDAWAPGGWYVDTWLDVSGNGNDFSVDATKYPRNYGNRLDGIRTVTFNGYSVTSRMLNTTIAIPDVRSMTIVRIFRPYDIYNADWGGMGYPTSVNGYSGVRTTSGLNFAGVPGSVRAAVTSPQVLIMNYKGASAGTLKQNGLITNSSALSPAASATGMTLGGSSLSPMGADYLVHAVYKRSLTSTEETAIQDLARPFDIVPVSETQGILPLIGDSITMGTVEAGTGVETTYAFKIQGLMSKRMTHMNMALAGETASSGAARAATLATMAYVSGMNCYAHVAYGSNDLAAHRSPAATYADILTIVNALYAKGYRKVSVGSVLPRAAGFTGGQTASGFETDRQTLRSLMIAGEDTDFDKLIDVGANPVVGNVANVSTYYFDLVHPNGIASDYIAADVAAGLDSMIP